MCIRDRIFTVIFGLTLRLFVPGGYISYTENVSGFLGYLIFPSLALALPKAAMTAKMFRNALLSEIHKDYIRTAKMCIRDRLVENHKELNALVKELDPTRLTTIAHVSMTPIESPLHHITDVISYNHYFGWYGGKMEDNGPWMDNFHKVRPDLCVGMSEYGVEGIITYHGPNPACKDYSEEYQALYHEHLAKMLDERPWIWSSHVWNMFDFGCAARDEGGVAGRNNKGLVTMDRKTKKDSYYIYKAYWNKAPMVHICGRRYAQRAGETDVYKRQGDLRRPEI